MSLRGLFITGTDTGVGKTHVAGAIVRLLRSRGVRVGAYKPVVSGSEPGPSGLVWNDVERLYEALDGELPRERICPQRWHAPLAPPVAAKAEGAHVDSNLLREGTVWWRERVDMLIVEGAGGLLSPMTETESFADLARDLGFPLVIVARRSLGTINHTLLTIEAARSRGLKIAGIILNQPLPPDPQDLSLKSNAPELAARTAVPILAVLPHAPPFELLREESFRKIDFVGLATPSG